MGLGQASAARVEVPENFLVTVKQWMDGRSKAMTSQASSGAGTPTPKPGLSATYPELQRKLEDAIARGDEDAKQTIMAQASQLGGYGTMQTPPAMAGGMT